MFKKLQSPIQGGRGWFITTEENVSGWLTVNGIIETTTVPIEDYYFDSELDAHNAALNYYYKHNHAYPYFNELHDLRRAQMNNENDTKDISGSQIMEFE